MFDGAAFNPETIDRVLRDRLPWIPDTGHGPRPCERGVVELDNRLSTCGAENPVQAIDLGVLRRDDWKT